jgi:hypothetical protein
MNKTSYLTAFIFVLLTLGCSNPLNKVSPVTCNDTEWFRVGRCFGRNDEPKTAKNYFPELCAKKNMPIEQASFDKGYAEGRNEVCTNRKLAYFYAAEFCRTGASKKIQTAIDEGRTARGLRQRIADYRKSQRDVEQHDTPDNALVNTILAPAGYAVDGKGSVGPDNSKLEAEIDKAENDLIALDKKYYPMEAPDVFQGPCNAMVKDTYMSGLGLAPGI